MNGTNIPDGFCACGCGGRTGIVKTTRAKRGLVAGGYYHYLPNHHRRSSPVPYLVNPATGCHEWQRSKSRQGYGRIWVGGRLMQAHRYYFEERFGPIPQGLVPDHTCNNPGCCNPEHLELVSQAENVRRSRHTRLNWETVQEIRQLRMTTDLTLDRLGERFGVAATTISAVISGRTWKDAA